MNSPLAGNNCMAGTTQIISKKHITNEIYKTFEKIKKKKNISIADFLNRLELSLFNKQYRKIKFPYNSLVKLVLFQKLKGIKFHTKLTKYLRRNPKDKFRLGFSETPDRTQIGYFVNHILDDQTKKIIDFIVHKIEEISEKFSILLDVQTLQPQPPIKETKERNQRLQRNRKTNDVCKIFKRRIAPFINFHQNKNIVYSKQELINLLIHLGLQQDFAENGSKTYRVQQNRGPSGKTLLYHLKKYQDIRELQRMYEILYEIVWDMTRQANLFDPRKRVDLAIDYHEWFYYGNRKTPMVVGKKPERGTDSCYKFATINIVESGKRFTLLALPVNALDDKERILSMLLLYALKRVKINKVQLDRGFFDSKSIGVLNHLGVKWLMPGQRNYAVRRAMELAPAPSVIKDFRMKNVQFSLAVGIGRNGEKQVFATNIRFNENDPKLIDWLFSEYSKRWGIETSYRVKKHSYRPKTTSKNYIIRLFYFLFSVLMYNLWILADILIWMYIHGVVGEFHLVTSRLFGMILMAIDPGG